ncbi:archease [Candidatus Fermentibacteria bacterium]|nr:archease [Candidatus Fermentibacteria bacterium]
MTPPSDRDGGWRELGWGSDAALLVWGMTLAELLDHGARAVIEFSTMAPSEPEAVSGPAVEINAPDTIELFIDWLSEVNYRLQVDRWLTRTPLFSVVSDTQVAARLDGYAMAGSATTFVHEIKAVTRHRPLLRRGTNGLWVARVVLDL